MGAVVLSNTGRSLAADAVAGAIRFIDVYDGSRPANPQTAVTSQVKLLRFTLPNPPFAAAVDGVATANAVPATTGLDNGTATWCRMLNAAEAVLADGDVDTAGEEVNLSTVSITVGGSVTLTSGTHTQTA